MTPVSAPRSTGLSSWRGWLLAATTALLAACGGSGSEPAASPAPQPAPTTQAETTGATDITNEAVLETMRRATRFIRENLAVNGGYVWAYAADGSRQWGEMEAYPQMVWIQPPGTATVGHVLLDAYHATGDEYFYESAAEVAAGLIGAQHPAGGWNYLHDFAGEESIQRWYDTIGKNGWRLEEFHHYYGNATFDDAGTSEASQFLLRMYLEKREAVYEAPLQKAIDFVLDSQYDNGGWPQRFPFVEDAPDLHGLPDYTRHITFNDDVADENIKFLLMVYQSLGDERALESIKSAMEIFPATLQPAPQAGWGLQHTVDTLDPIGARSYEPTALVTSSTAGNAAQMMDFFEWTGERRFLEPLPEVFDWLESVRLAPEQVVMTGREYPTFIEIGTNKAIFNHRRGSNVINGEYYHDYNPDNPIRHYSQWRSVNLDGLRERHARLMETSPEDMRANSPLNRQDGFALPKYFSVTSLEVSDLNSNIGAVAIDRPDDERIRELVDGLNEAGYWPTPLRATSNPYIGDGPAEPAEGDFGGTHVGDAYDTSPYMTDDPETGISIGTYIQNMSALMQAYDSRQ
ncbi:pectate lyase [Marinihelvus fidelis]|uniref:Pectate lyase n=2 Tax=Marinihelvus fidelis TaxID=2613842 RepID=A0A5N0TCZ9_9GAMM|nr:pectate lyase [Marinihelvus fidelis]